MHLLPFVVNLGGGPVTADAITSKYYYSRAIQILETTIQGANVELTTALATGMLTEPQQADMMANIGQYQELLQLCQQRIATLAATNVSDDGADNEHDNQQHHNSILSMLPLPSLPAPLSLALNQMLGGVGTSANRALNHVGTSLVSMAKFTFMLANPHVAYLISLRK